MLRAEDDRLARHVVERERQPVEQALRVSELQRRLARQVDDLAAVAGPCVVGHQHGDPILAAGRQRADGRRDAVLLRAAHRGGGRLLKRRLRVRLCLRLRECRLGLAV
eukprot:scaffold27059_cov43-Phaeocystis_antarctica.AAC.2